MATPTWQQKTAQNLQGQLNATGRSYSNLVDNAVTSKGKS